MTSPVRLFSDRSHYRRQHRSELAAILRPSWKDDAFTDEERQQCYGVSSSDFCLVKDLAECDLAVLPMSWNFYLAHRHISLAREFIDRARRTGSAILSYVTGDEGVLVPPEFNDLYVVRASGSRSRRQPRQFAQPVFFEDPAGSSGIPNDAGECDGAHRAAVGFCGQANSERSKMTLHLLRAIFRFAAHRLGWRLEEPQPLVPPSVLRARALRVLAESPLVETRFIIRERYRAGAVDSHSRSHTSREFYNNILETQYTLCVRGGGNFSKRFYETLALGRIPVLLDTDCLLPFEDQLNWDAYVVRVPAPAWRQLPQRVASHFSRTSSGGLRELQRKCRALWENWLSFGGFHKQLVHTILGRSVSGQGRATAPMVAMVGGHN